MSRASKSKPLDSKTPAITNNALQNSWVFIFKDDAVSTNNNDEKTANPIIVHLKHPGTKNRALFLFSKKIIQEIISFSEPKRSWFIEETVKSDGTFYLSTPVDPLFLILPYIRDQCGQNAVPLEQVLQDSEFPETDKLISICKPKQLSLIADQKGPEELQAYKFNHEKTLIWLQKKCLKVAEVLKNKKIHVGQGAASATFIKSEKCEPESEELYLKYAHGILSDYIDDELSMKLSKHLNLPEDIPSHKRKSSSTNDKKSNKKIKTELNSSLEDSFNSSIIVENTSKPKTITSKEKAFVKAASGTKSISSFFKKK